MEEDTDVITQIDMILSRYDEIDGEGLGPWSEVSEVMEQEREAEKYLKGINKSNLQKKLAQAMSATDDPWRYVEYFVGKYHKEWVIQPTKFLNKIIESSVVIKSITKIVPKISKNIQEVENPSKILEFLITLNLKIREYDEIKNIVKRMMDSEEEVDTFLVSHSLRLNKVEENAISKIEKFTGRIPFLEGASEASVKKDIIYGLGAINHIKWGYSMENGKIISLGINFKEIPILPDCLGELTNLRLLSLSGLGLNSIPESIGNLIKLEGLYLDSNNLEKIPESIGNCTDYP